MKILKKEIFKYPAGIWITLMALLLLFVAWIMQIYSLVDWEGAVAVGLQEKSFLGNEIDKAIADVERGIAIADLLWGLPLTLLAFIGILRKKYVGFVASLMVFSIGIYFPLFYTFRDNISADIILTVNLVWLFPSMLGIWALWVNRSIFNPLDQ